MKYIGLIIFFSLVITETNGQVDASPKSKVTTIRKDFYDKMIDQNKIVCDFTKSLNSAQLKVLDSLWKNFYRISKKGIVTSILDSGRIAAEDFYSFSESIFNNLPLVNDENTIYIIASPELKKVKIFKGNAIKKYLPDETVDSIISTEFLRYFKNKSFFEGIKRGTEAIISTIKRNGG